MLSAFQWRPPFRLTARGMTYLDDHAGAKEALESWSCWILLAGGVNHWPLPATIAGVWSANTAMSPGLADAGPMGSAIGLVWPVLVFLVRGSANSSFRRGRSRAPRSDFHQRRESPYSYALGGSCGSIGRSRSSPGKRHR